MALFRGSAPALITPFCESGVDFEAYGRIIEYTLDGGSSAVVVLGTTGEPSTMTQEEKCAVIEYAVKKVNKRVPVIVGTGGNNTVEVIKASKIAERLGADALLIVTPYYNKCTQKGLIAHYTEIAKNVSKPIIMYNVPGRTGVNLLPATALALALASVKNIIAVKEASGNIEQISELIRLCRGKLDIYSGDDGIVLPFLALGADGVISVTANAVPDIMSDICAKFFSGDCKAAAELQHKVNPFVKAAFIEVNPIPIKTAMSLMGYCGGMLRLPLTDMEDNNLAYLRKEMTALGLIK